MLGRGAHPPSPGNIDPVRTGLAHVRVTDLSGLKGLGRSGRG